MKGLPTTPTLYFLYFLSGPFNFLILWSVPHFLGLSLLCAKENLWRARGVELLGQQKLNNFFICLAYLGSVQWRAGVRGVLNCWVNKN